MISGTAGSDVYLRDAAEFFISESSILEFYRAVRCEGRIDGVPYRSWLLVDLFDHEVLVAAFFSSFGVPLNSGYRLINHVPIEIVELSLAGYEARHLQVADVADVSRVPQKSRHVGCQISGIFRHTDDQRAILPCSIDLARTISEHQSQRKRTPDPYHGLRHGVYRVVGVFFVIIVHEFDQDLGIGLAVKGIAVSHHLVSQFLIILNDAVVDADDVGIVLAGAGALEHVAYMRMSVDFTGFAVGGPPGVADAAGPGEGFAAVGLVIEILESSLGFDQLKGSASVADGYARRIIASVFEF